MFRLSIRHLLLLTHSLSLAITVLAIQVMGKGNEPSAPDASKSAKAMKKPFAYLDAREAAKVGMLKFSIVGPVEDTPYLDRPAVKRVMIWLTIKNLSTTKSA